MKLLLTILACLVAASAGAQTIKSLGYNTTNGKVVYSGTNTLAFTNLSGVVLQNGPLAVSEIQDNSGNSIFMVNDQYFVNASANGGAALDWGGSSVIVGLPISFAASSNAATTRTNLGLGATNNVTFSNITASGTLAVTGNVTMSGVDNLAAQQTASSASSLMTRGLSDVRYLGEMWNASKMAAYATTNPSVTVFLNEAMATYTNLQPQGPFMQEFIPAEKYAGKTVKLLAYCRVNSTNGGNVQGSGRVIYLTNTAGGADSNFPLSLGGQSHGTVGVFTNAGTDVFPVATSTNQYLIFTSNVGTIPTNARMIVAAFGFNRASTNTTYTNNLYMHAVQLVVENP